MGKVVVVTDSTAYIPAELMADLEIEVIPLNLIFGEETLLDGVDIMPEEFYEKLKKSKIVPTTSQPSPAAFKQVYEKHLEEGKEIISIHISSALSGTVDSAIQAKEMLGAKQIEVVDSQVTTMALGFPALAVAKAANEGASLLECKALAEKCVSNSGAIFTTSTLEYLRRGGRIGGASAFLGTALDLKPILTLKDGKLEAMERVRTLNKALDKIVEHLKSRLGHQTPIQIAGINAQSQNEATKIIEKARNVFGVSEIDVAVIADVSPVIGTHTGPGTVGIAYMARF